MARIWIDRVVGPLPVALIFHIPLAHCSWWLRLHSPPMRPGAMAAAAKLPRLTISAALFPTPRPLGSRPAKAKPMPPRITISMDPVVVDPAHLQALMLACAHSCAIRPSPPAAAAADPVDLRKLRVALAHSFLVVSVFCSARLLDDGDEDGGGDGRRLLGLDLGLGRREDRRLVGFGRAVSDVGLTASVHDVVVHPSLQTRGIGRQIVERITRVLHNRGIFDISTLCTEKESANGRPFFEACGFGDDAMGSTTMMYTGKMHK